MAALLRSPKVEEAPCRLSFSQSADTAVTSEASDTISEFSTPKAASVPDQVRPTHMDERLDEQVSPTDRPDEDGSHAHTMIIERLEAELATLRASIADEKAAARQEGFSAGFDDGVAEGRAQFEEQVARVKAIAEELAGQGDALRKTHQDELVDLLAAAREKIDQGRDVHPLADRLRLLADDEGEPSVAASGTVEGRLHPRGSEA